MKYEMIFGDERLFDGAPEDAEAVFKSPKHDSRPAYYRLLNGHERYHSGEWIQVPQINSQTFNAMRRIIHAPKRWTLEDKNAGMLPDVGCKCIWVDKSGEPGPEGMKYPKNGCEVEIIAHYENDNNSVAAFKFKTEEGMYVAVSMYVDDFKPIETPEEKAKRERAEWAEHASKFIDDELDCVNLVGDRVMRKFYDAILSGELPTPKKG